MTTITIRHVPPRVRNELAARASRQGRSLQEFMLSEVTDLASRPAVADLVAEVQQRKARSGRQIGREEIIEARDADRR